MKRRLLLVCCVLLLIGCKDFQTKKLSSDKLVKDGLETLDWKSLDTYPSYQACAEHSTKQALKQCFEKETSRHIYHVLSKHQVTLKDSVHEKVELTISISDKGEPALEKTAIPSIVDREIPQIKQWLEQAVQSLPKIFPAEKRGVPVSTTYKIPLVIESK